MVIVTSCQPPLTPNHDLCRLSSRRHRASETTVAVVAASHSDALIRVASSAVPTTSAYRRRPPFIFVFFIMENDAFVDESVLEDPERLRRICRDTCFHGGPSPATCAHLDFFTSIKNLILHSCTFPISDDQFVLVRQHIYVNEFRQSKHLATLSLISTHSLCRLNVNYPCSNVAQEIVVV